MKKLLYALAISATFMACTKENYITNNSMATPSIVGATGAQFYVNDQLVTGQVTVFQFLHQMEVKVTVPGPAHLDLIATINGHAFREKFVDLHTAGSYTLAAETDFTQYLAK